MDDHSDIAYLRDSITVEEPEGFTQVPDSLLLNTDVSDGAYRLYALLKHHARQGNSAYPGRRRLASMLGVKSVRTVDARIAELKTAGYLRVTARFYDRGGQGSNVYHLYFYPRPVTSVDGHPQGEQQVAPSPCNEMRPAGAAECAPPVQTAAPQRSTSLPSTHTPNPEPVPVAAARPGEGEGLEGPGERPDADAAAAAREFGKDVLAQLPAQLQPRTRSQHAQFTALLEPLAGHGTPQQVAGLLTGSRPLPDVVTHPAGLLKSRIETLPPAPASRNRRDRRPWCGVCDERTRCLLDEELDKVRRCPDCHPETDGWRQGALTA